jgi:polyphosphate kinase 2 (PPK2 family)
LADQGIIKIARTFKNIIEPYDGDADVPDYLSLVNHDFALDKKPYEKALEKEETKLNDLVRRLKDLKITVIVVFQGRDAAGKSGATKRIVEGLDWDWRILGVVPVGAPNEEERNQNYLLRFFEKDRMPGFGEVRVFDRGWPEDVLVVPIMKYASEKHVENSFPEIRSMEWMLRRSRAVVVKLWLDITKDEQKKRFDARQADKRKRHKYQESDRIAREHWDDYTQWANRMFYWHGTDFAPWYLIPANDKRYSRVACLRVINNAIAKEIKKPFRGI